jgi:hypothetical protein
LQKAVSSQWHHIFFGEPAPFGTPSALVSAPGDVEPSGTKAEEGAAGMGRPPRIPRQTDFDGDYR